MRRFLLICAFLMACAGCAMADRADDQSKTVTIPLDQIWAWRMPDTRDVRELEPDHFGERTRSLPSEVRSQLLTDSLTERIRQVLKYPEPRSADAGAGFAVLGRGLEALREAYAVLVKQQQVQQSFPEDSEISAVFFSHLFGSYVHLEQVEKRRNTITIQYRFVPHATKEVTSHFAIMPLGKLPVGKYQVRMIQLPIDQQRFDTPIKYTPAEKIRRIICQPFSFSVVQR